MTTALDTIQAAAKDCPPPSHMTGALTILARNGIAVTYRRNRHGSYRFVAEGRGECDALPTL